MVMLIMLTGVHLRVRVYHPGVRENFHVSVDVHRGPVSAQYDHGGSFSRASQFFVSELDDLRWQTNYAKDIQIFWMLGSYVLCRVKQGSSRIVVCL